MTWTAIVPIKPPSARKTRLGGLDAASRLALTERLLDHVLATVGAHPAIDATFLLADRPGTAFGWLPDEGRGLNAELEAARSARPALDILIVHADLPMVAADDIAALLEAADRHGAALAPDRHGLGSNAIALKAETVFTFHFGPGSFALHAAQLPSAAAIVERAGLALDIDTQDDLRLSGWS